MTWLCSSVDQFPQITWTLSWPGRLPGRGRSRYPLSAASGDAGSSNSRPYWPSGALGQGCLGRGTTSELHHRAWRDRTVIRDCGHELTVVIDLNTDSAIPPGTSLGVDKESRRPEQRDGLTAGAGYERSGRYRSHGGRGRPLPGRSAWSFDGPRAKPPLGRREGARPRPGQPL